MLVAFTFTPMGVEASVANYIANSVQVVRESCLPNRSDSMYTMIEGKWEEAMDMIKRATDAVAARAPRVKSSSRQTYDPRYPIPLTGKSRFSNNALLMTIDHQS